MKRKEYGLRYRLPDQITDVVPESRSINELAPMHCHDFYEIQVITGGSGTEVLNGTAHTLQRGTVTLLSPSDFHSLEPHGELRFYNFMFRGTMLSRELLQSVWTMDGNKVLFFEGDDLQAVISICRLLEWANQKPTADRAVLIRNMMESFFLLLMRAMEKKPGVQHKDMNDVIQSSILYLHQHFTENPSLSETAAAVNWHPNYFSQRFREVTGHTYTAYLTRLKLSYAKKLLLSSKQSVTEICFASGFTSVSNFMKVFKTRTGMAPRQFVEENSRKRQDET